jgi:hypothetical protein
MPLNLFLNFILIYAAWPMDGDILTVYRAHKKVCADTDVVAIFFDHLYVIFLITQPLTHDRSSTTRSGNK